MKARCTVCRGLKKLYKLGCLKKDCPNCNGTGFVEDEPKPSELKVGLTEPEEDTPAQPKTKSNVKSKSKKGRKK